MVSDSTGASESEGANSKDSKVSRGRGGSHCADAQCECAAGGGGGDSREDGGEYSVVSGNGNEWWCHQSRKRGST